MRIAPAPRAFAVLFLSLGLVTAPAARADGPHRQYVAGGTVVVRDSSGTVVDNGAVVCDDGEGVGSGGVCLPFGGGDAVKVVDGQRGEDVPFQVCIDNNGDGFCRFQDTDPTCPDYIAFSHSDDGSFANPVGPVPTGFTTGCPGGAWNGYVVLLCQGAHDDGVLHTHEATTGKAFVTGNGEGLGTFCGVPFSVKAYHATSGNATCSLYAQDDVSPEAGDDGVVGVLTLGPWRRPGSLVTVRCSVRTETSLIMYREASGPDVVYASEAVSFVSPVGEPLWLCTEVSYDGGALETVDVVAGTAGVQCARVREVAHGDVRVLTVAATIKA